MVGKPTSPNPTINPTLHNMHTRSFRVISITVASLAVSLATSLHGADAAPAAKPAAAKAATFVEIKPLLEKYCYSCHGGDDAAKAAGKAAGSMSKSALTMDTLENLTKGGKSKKPGIVAGKSAESEVVARLKLAAAKGKGFMPPKDPSPTADEIKKIADWIDAGAAAK